MLKIILAIVLFSVIVIFHELGHFLFAKKNGICVEEFAIGIGPTIFGKQIGETKDIASGFIRKTENIRLMDIS